MSFKELLCRIRDDLDGQESFSFKLLIHSYLFNASFRLLLNYRIGKYLYLSDWKICRIISQRYKMVQMKRRNCYISFKADIGKGVRFAHPLGIVIGDGVIIGANVKIWQQVTFGSHGRKGEDPGYPVIEDNVRIYAGAKLFGKIRIGKDAIIGANAVVLHDVPENCTAVGIPARLISHGEV